MLNIFICEDNLIQQNKFKKIISDIISTHNYDMEIVLATPNPYDVIDYLKSTPTSGMYFLDVDLNSDINGIQLAEKIRKYDPRGFIIFITSYAEMSHLTFLYKVEAMDYIIKDTYANIKKRIADCIKNANEKHKTTLNMSQDFFSLKSNDKIINVNFNDIIFFETSSTIHKIILHCCNRQIEFYGKMKEIEEKLDKRFCRCHNSFIVNMDKVKEIDKKNRIAYMINDEECLISTRGIKKLIK